MMLFWRKKADKPEAPAGPAAAVQVNEIELPVFIENSFVAANSGTIGRAERLYAQIGSDCSEMQAAVQEFSAGTAKPNMEYAQQERLAEMQKGRYTGMLKHAMQPITEAEEEHGGVNRYERCRLRADAAELIINSIGQANFKAKHVIYGYVAQLGRVKRAFEALQAHTKELRSIVDSSSNAYERYSEMMLQAERLAVASEESARLADSIGGRKQQEGQGDGAGRVKELADALEKENAILHGIDAEIAGINAMLVGYLGPLARPARKYDHITKGKRHLSDFIDNPVEAIQSDEDYTAFEGMLSSMAKMVDEGSMENTKDVREQIDAVRGAGMQKILKRAKELEESRSAALQVTKEASLEHSRAVEEGRSAAETIAGRKAAELRISELGKERDSIKAKIAELVHASYGKRISII